MKLNQIIPQALAKMPVEKRPQLVHQTGAKNFESALTYYREAGVLVDSENLNSEIKVEAFIEDMSSVYEWADVVICRAGAMTVFESAAAGEASVLVPYPLAVDDHQTQNALYLERAGAAIIKQQGELTAEWVANLLTEFSADRKKQQDMAVAARKLAIPGAAKTIADACLSAGGIT